jgi:SPP1 family predicted phage head-tail adaptor
VAAAKVRLGQMRHRVVLQAASRPQDASGEPVESWSDVATLWAKVEPLSATETYRARQAGAELSHRVTVHYRAGVTPTGNRLKLGDRVLNVRGVRCPDEARVWLELSCLEEL